MLSLSLVLLRSMHFTARLTVPLTPTISIDILYRYMILKVVYILCYIDILLQYSMIEHSMQNIKYYMFYTLWFVHSIVIHYMY